MPISHARDAERKQAYRAELRGIATSERMAELLVAGPGVEAPVQDAPLTPWVRLGLMRVAVRSDHMGQFMPAIRALELLGRDAGMWPTVTLGESGGGVTVNVQVNLLPTDSAAKLVRSSGSPALSGATESGAETGIVVRTIKGSES